MRRKFSKVVKQWEDLVNDYEDKLRNKDLQCQRKMEVMKEEYEAKMRNVELDGVNTVWNKVVVHLKDNPSAISDLFPVLPSSIAARLTQRSNPVNMPLPMYPLANDQDSDSDSMEVLCGIDDTEKKPDVAKILESVSLTSNDKCNPGQTTRSNFSHIAKVNSST